MLSRHPSPPRLWLFYVGWGGCRVWGDVSVACGFARPDATLFWPRVSSPLLSRVPSCRVPARRFKDPGGVALPPPGSGGGGARREVGRSFGRLSLRLHDPPPPAAAVPEAAVVWGGGCLEPPLGARGGPTRAAGLPDFRGSVLSVPVVGSRVVPVFFRSRPFFFFLPPTRVSFRSSLAGLRLPLGPSVLLSLRGEEGGGRWGTVPSSAPVSSLTPEIPIRLLAVDHSARASMKNAASCEN